MTILYLILAACGICPFSWAALIFIMCLDSGINSQHDKKEDDEIIQYD